MELWEMWVLLAQGCWFPLHFRVRVAGCVVEGSVELQISVCARKRDLLPSTEKWSLELVVTSGVGRALGVLSYKSFFPFFPWLVASLFVDSERGLLLAGYGTL
jgi:hypothetical protein